VIKITPADRWFSLCVRIRSNWTCEYAGTYFPDPSSRNGLHCSHYFGRGNWSTRFDRYNAFAHSYGSHQHLGAGHNRQIFEQWVIEQIGAEAHEALISRSQDISLGREFRKLNKIKKGRTTLLAEHFKKEYERLEEMRNDGETGRLEFNGYFDDPHLLQPT